MTLRTLAAGLALIAAIVLFSLAADACERGRPCATPGAAEARPAAPLRLNAFVKKRRPKPASTRVAAAAEAPAVALPRPRPELGDAHERVAAAQPDADVAEIDGVRLAAADEVNEIDLAADGVQVVAPDELNEIDMAVDMVGMRPADEPRAEASESPLPEPEKTSWLGRLMVALGGAVAAASALRLFVG